MDISKKQFKIVFTNDCKQEMDNIYNYISNNLYAPKAAKELMNKVETTIQSLKDMPEAYMTIKKYDELKMEYRRIIINNYVIIYTISEEKNIIYIVHMYYGRSNYFEYI